MPIVMSSVLIAALWAGRALGAACDPALPMALPITDTAVDPDIPDSLMRGIPAKIGTPPQNIVVLPWPDLNNTYVYDEEAYCDSSIIFNDKICEIRRGSLFQDDASSSFSKYPDLIAAGGATQELSNVRGAELGVAKLLSTSLAGTERFAAGPANFTTMALGIPRLNWDHGYTTAHALGLGSNSTFLNAMVQAGQIPSRVWSIFWGRMWTGSTATDMDGSVVLGGYDRAKVIGRNVTQALDYSEGTGCWTGMLVTVTNLLVNFRNGSDHSVMPRNSAVQCCIVPQRQLVWEGPVDVVGDFVSATGMESTGPSFGLHWNAQQFNASDALFDGDATFVLSNGLQVRIPNDQLITPFVAVDRNGSRTVDKRQRELLMGAVSDNPTTLGRYFFTAAYLMVDHDAGTFTMWQANPSDRTDLVSVVSKSTDGEGGCESGHGNAGGSTGAGENTDSNGPTSSSVNAGAIAGGVVGGVAGVGVIAALVFFFLRRKKRREGQEGQDMPPSYTQPMVGSEGYTAYHGEGSGVGYYKASHVARHEAPGTEHGPGELDGVPSHGHTSMAWTANSGTVPGSAVTYELDGGGMPRH